MNILIIGGTSGLGLELAKRLADQNNVTVTGRRDPRVVGIRFHHLDLSDFDGDNCVRARRRMLNDSPEFDWLIYAAGFEQQAGFSDISWASIKAQINVGLAAPMWFCHELMKQFHGLPNLLMITSTSQWRPRPNEVPYAAVKAAEAHMARSLAGEGGIAKVLIAGPSGMATDFWRNTQRDTSKDLPPSWVAERIVAAWNDPDWDTEVEPCRGIKLLGAADEIDWQTEPMVFMR